MNRKLYWLLISAVLLCFACKDNTATTKKQTVADENLFGLWHYADFPGMYAQITDTGYVDYVGGPDATITYAMQWTDKTHYTLEVKDLRGVEPNDELKPGAKVTVEIKAVTPDHCWIVLTHKNTAQCLLLTRKKDYKPTGPKPC
ncbi:MAG TPA: hypothetical protein VD993_18585 [Chitinophagaceae bacterium]|nr:hypothetical protein [Chitinophagaceae bacterium]